MTRWCGQFALLLLSFTVLPPALALQVPDGAYSTAPKGPETICGIRASSALEFKEKIREAGLAHADGGPRFDVFMTPDQSDDMVQWAITKVGEPAYPAVTCRHLYKAPDGSWMQKRQMRCDADRASCDALFKEFLELDERMRAALAAKVKS